VRISSNLIGARGQFRGIATAVASDRTPHAGATSVQPCQSGRLWPSQLVGQSMSSLAGFEKCLEGAFYRDVFPTGKLLVAGKGRISYHPVERPSVCYALLLSL